MTLMESLRVRVGLQEDDTSKDTEITAAKDSAFSLMGNYCDRIFPQSADAEEVFTHFVGMTVSLKRYPIQSIASVVDDEGVTVDDYHIEADTGLIHLDYHSAFHQLIVTFSGGYDEDALPPDLLMAFYAVFDQEYAYVEGQSTTSASGELSSVTVADVGTVRYNTSADSSGASFLPSRAESILADYVRYKC